MNIDVEKIGRFDRSFIVVMVRDFFLVLLGVIIFELGLRYLLVYYEFEHEQKELTIQAAEHLAQDVSDIMRNKGGPVAARTFYPIMKRDQQGQGMEIAIVPSEVTVESIELEFDFIPRGIPADWPEGKHHEYSLDIRAEPFCLSCHITANTGDILGSVSVRNYFKSHLDSWWKEVQLTSLLGLGKILFHTLILFFLLRTRMEPLLSLRTTIASLSRAGFDLSRRAKLNSEDEFAELGHDLNLFLDRMTHVLEDLNGVLVKITALDKRLSDVRKNMGDRFKLIGDNMSGLAASMFRHGEPGQILTEQWQHSLELLQANLQIIEDGGHSSTAWNEQIKQLAVQLQMAVKNTSKFMAQFQRTGEELVRISADTQEFAHYIAEIRIIEDKMLGITEIGQTMLDRLAGKN